MGAGEIASGFAENRRAAGSPSGYENGMVLITSLIVGLVAFDRLATGYVGPYLVKAFSLSNLELGALYSVQALAVAGAGYGAGMLSDATGWRRRILVAALALAAVLAIFSGLAPGFVMLAFARFLMGGAEGAFSTMTQSIVALQSSPHRRGLNMGIQTLLMFLISAMLGPILLTRLADHWGWPAAFFAFSLPAVLLAALVLVAIRPVAKPPASAPGEKRRAAEPYGRNIWLCMVISALFMFWLVIHNTFLPLYLVQQRGMEPVAMGQLLSVLGAAGCVGGLMLPTLSDRMGRRTAMMIAMGLATVLPLTVLFIHGSPWLLAIGLFLGWLSVGALPIYAVVIPGESVSPQRVGSTIAMVIAMGELVGGVAGPVFAGGIADAFGLAMPFWFTLLAALLCLGLSSAFIRAPVHTASAA